MKTVWWIFVLSALILGVLGYVQDLTEEKWKHRTIIILLSLFVLVSIGQAILDWVSDRRVAENFYSEELVRVFPKDVSQNVMQFFTDKHGNKCVAFTLEYEPIPKSVKLWEGGYSAPPITLAVASNKVIFLNSDYTSYDQYRNNSLLYQIRYYPRK